MTATTVGFIGLGNLGGRRAARLRDAGVIVIGFDPREGIASGLGIETATSAGDVFSRTGAVLLSLPDDKVVGAVMRQPDVVASLREGHTIIDLSTSTPDASRTIASEIAPRGATFLDAGISGGAAAAEAGALTIMIGGGAADVDRVRPLLAPVAARVVHCGGVGAGHTVKLLNNFLNAVTLAATSEVMVAAKKAGLDLGTVLEVINASSGVSFASQKRFPSIIRGDYLEGGLTNSLMLKDVSLYLSMLADLGVSSLNSAGPVASFGLARALGYADRISNTVVDAIGDVSGGIRLYDDTAQSGTDRTEIA